MNYLEKLKQKISLPHVLPKLPKAKKTENKPISGTAKTAKRGFGSKSSSRSTHISEKTENGPKVKKTKNTINLDDFTPLPRIKKTIHDHCPAKCKRSGKCYATVYFFGKAGKAVKCDPERCKYTSKWN